VSRHVALLRGLNVGAHDRIRMKELVVLFEAAGCREVSTYIQSGNVVFEAGAALAKAVPGLVAGALRAERGFEVPVVARTAAQFKKVAAGHLLAKGADEAHLHVGFLRIKPTASRVAALDPARSPQDEFLVQGREIYFYCPNGLAGTKLSNAWFDSQLDTVTTVRNWKTVRALAELCGVG